MSESQDTNSQPPTGNSVAAMKRTIEDAAAKRINSILAETGCQLVPLPAFVPDGSGGFRLTVGVNVKFGG